jgi:hypothetical protein
MMPERSARSIKVDPDIEEYIRSKSSDMRICTTCEGPILMPVRFSAPKPTDTVMEVGERKLYISAVQASYIKKVDAKMLPRCALEKKTRCR